MIRTICVGYILIIDNQEYVVSGRMVIRGKTYYTLKDNNGSKSSIGREKLLKLILTGSIILKS